jgi:hypothetical protein
MTQDEIMEMARQAGLFTHKEVQPEIVTFAKLVAAKERLENPMREVQKLGQEIEQEQQIETLKRCLFQMQEAAKDLAERAKSLTPPQRKPLTDEQKLMCWSRATHDADVEHKTEHQCLMDYGSEIEAAHGIKENT